MSRLLIIQVLLLVGVSIYAQKRNPHIIKGNRLYKEKKYDLALPEYKKAFDISSDDPVTSYNLGNAFYRNAKFEDAEKTFENSIEGRSDAAIKQKSYYNKGVSLSRQNKLEESIDAYKIAVKMDPKDNDARINLQKALLELKKKMPPPPEKKEEKKKKQQNKNQNNPPPKSNLTKKQVEQLLKALQQREQQVQQKMQQRNRTAGQQEKDW